MPTINTWISDDDYNKYLVVKQKGKGSWTKFIHNALNTTHVSTKTLSDLGKSLDIARPPIDILKQGNGGRYNGDSPIAEEELAPPSNLKENSDGTISIKDSSKPAVVKNKPWGKPCKHGSLKGFCMHKEATRLKCNV